MWSSIYALTPIKLVVMGYANYFFQKFESFPKFLICSCTQQGFSRFTPTLLQGSPSHSTGRFNPFGLNRLCSHLFPHIDYVREVVLLGTTTFGIGVRTFLPSLTLGVNSIWIVLMVYKVYSERSEERSLVLLRQLYLISFKVFCQLRRRNLTRFSFRKPKCHRQPRRTAKLSTGQVQ